MDEMRARLISVSAKLFLRKGYSSTSLREIASEAGVNIGSLMHLFQTKETLLCELVNFVLEGQFRAAEQLLDGITDDKQLFWAAETTLQLYMAESDEKIRELYDAAYSLPKTSAIIYQNIAEKIHHYFGELHPEYEKKDFYELEIASGSIIRGFIAVRCDVYFTMERKVKRYIETAFRVYGADDGQIARAIAFVSQFDFKKIASQTIDAMLAYLENPMHSSIFIERKDQNQ